MALIEKDPVNPYGKIDPKEVHSPEDLENSAALQLCVQDTLNTESYLQTNFWSLRWREADILYQALKLDTPVRTAGGFKPISDIHVGDEVFGRDGKLHKVLGESPIFKDRLCYEIEFETGERVVADACHLWETVAANQTVGSGMGSNPNSRKKGVTGPEWHRGHYKKVRSTEDIAKTVLYGKQQRHNHKIVLPAPLDCDKKDFAIDPYTFGAWLGDGDSDAPRVTSADLEIISQIEGAENHSAKCGVFKSKAARYTFSNYSSPDKSLQTRLRNIGVLENKHIPLDYLNGSKAQRLALLQGLLDTDGSCSKDGSVTFRNTNHSLALGVKALSCSLGWKASVKTYYYPQYIDGVVYSVHFTPTDIVFRLPRKASRQNLSPKKNRRGHIEIVSVTPVPSVPVKCISVEGDFFLVTDGLIATHNSPPSVMMWEGTTQPRANVNRFVVAEVVNSIHPQVLNGLFYESPAFVLRPRPNISQNTSRAITEVLAIELELMGIRQEVDWGVFSALNFGTGIWKWGFKSEQKTQTKYVPIGKPVKVPSPIAGQPATEIETPDSLSYKKEVTEKDIHLPTFEYRDIRHVLVDKGCRVPDIRKAKFVIDRMYLTYRDLEKLADEEYTEVDEETGAKTLKKRYMLPDKDTIKSWFEPPIEQPVMPGASQAAAIEGTTYVHHAAPAFKKTTEDPLDEPLEVLERWDNNKVITVLNRVKCIRNEPNEFGVIPFLSCNWWNIPDAFWGLGLGRVIGVEQRVQQGLINACLDLASLIVNPMFIRSRGANIQEQNIRQRLGGILTADGPVKEAFSILEQPTIPNEVIQQIGLSQARVESTTGANQQLTMGASGGKQGAMRSGTGANGVIQATMNRIGGFAEMFVKQVYEPLLYQVHQMNKDKMPVPYIRELLGDKLGPEFKFDAGDYLNAPAEFEVLAGSHLAAKAQMAQSLFMMIQLFESQPMMDQLSTISNKKINIEELLHMVHDVSGFKNYYNIVVDMTPEEVAAKKAAQNNPAQQIQGKMMLNNQKFSQQQQLVDQENEARVVRDILRHIAEKSSEPEALLGASAPTEGMGSSENS